ncbi:MAG: hypothetical protein QM809_01080 [Gordonia sp. (in: high G+C Gram-positive bacteria)]|uniref:hypothetical protein n=1 Tax=Gordonia sp. (in: high G+C Gram-positive bacteria) TaxID=84139 RepID=UPI0039E2B664
MSGSDDQRLDGSGFPIGDPSVPSLCPVCDAPIFPSSDVDKTGYLAALDAHYEKAGHYRGAAAESVSEDDTAPVRHEMFTCVGCGGEAGISCDDPGEVDEFADQWADDHRACGSEPAAVAVTPLHEVICPDCSEIITVELDPAPKAPNGWALNLTRVEKIVDDHEKACPGAPLAPVRQAWLTLVGNGDRPTICHYGDTSSVTDLARPSWSDPDYDHIGHGLAYYSSAPAGVAFKRDRSINRGRGLTRTTVEVSAQLSTAWGLRVGIVVAQPTRDGDEACTALASPAEARQLAAVLCAAADLAESETSA